MADNCAYCRKPLRFFSGSALICANSEEIFCSDCYDKLFDFDRWQRARAVLEHGLAANPGALRIGLELHEQEEAEKQAAVTSELSCVRCNVPMMSLGRKKFQMGEHTFWTGDHSHIQEGSLETELLVCPKCRRLEYLLPADSEFFPAEPEPVAAPAVPEPPSEPGAPVRGKKPPWER